MADGLRTIDIFVPDEQEFLALRKENEELRKRVAALTRQLTESQDYAFNLLTQLDELHANGHDDDNS